MENNSIVDEKTKRGEYADKEVFALKGTETRETEAFSFTAFIP